MDLFLLQFSNPNAIAIAAGASLLLLVASIILSVRAKKGLSYTSIVLSSLTLFCLLLA